MQDVGNQLRLIREEQGYSLDDVERATKIRRYYIEALENGDLDIMPGEVYTIGFAKSYGKFLGLDENEVSSVYKAYYSQLNMISNRQRSGEQSEIKSNPDAREDRRPPRGDAVGRAGTGRSNYNGRPLKTRKNSFGNKFIWLLLILVIVAAIVILAITVFGKDDETTPPSLPVNGGVSNPAEPNGGTEPDNNVVAPNTADGVNLVLTVGDSACNVSVNCDGTTTNATLEPGSTTTYTANEYIQVTYSNAPAVSVNLNGNDLGQVDNTNANMRVNYVPDGIDYAMPLAE